MPTPNEPKNFQEVVITPAGFVRRSIVETPLPNTDAIISRVVGRNPIVMPRLATGHMGGVIHGRHEGGSLTLAQHIPHLLLTTFFYPTTEYLHPCWKNNRPSAVKLDKLQWVPPAGTHLWFVTDYGPESGAFPTCYLLLATPESRLNRALPLPNLFEDGRLCMGHAAEVELTKLAPQAASLALHASALQLFMDSTWNSDLEPNADAVRSLFRFDFDGKQVASFDDHWRNHCHGLSSNIYNWLTDQAATPPAL